MMEPVFGKYLSSRGDGGVYTYALLWHHSGDCIAWHAVIQSQGKIVGRPQGAIDSRLADAQCARLVPRLVEEAIERRVGFN